MRVMTALVIGLFISNISSAQCPVISDIVIPRGCENAPFDSLQVVSTSDSIEIVAYPFGTGIDPYTTAGGTSLSIHEMPASGTLNVQPYPHSLPSGFYLFYAIAHPTPADPDCRPSDVQSVEIFEFIDLQTTDGVSCENGRINLEDYVSGTSNSNFVRFFNSSNDAFNGTNAISEFDYPSAPRFYFVSAQATNSSNVPENCVSVDSFFIDIQTSPTANAGADLTICEGENTTLAASGGNTYSWAPASLLTDPNIASPTANIEQTTVFAVTVTDANGCKDVDQITINVTQLPVCPPISGSQN